MVKETFYLEVMLSWMRSLSIAGLLVMRLELTMKLTHSLMGCMEAARKSSSNEDKRLNTYIMSLCYF